MVQSRTAIAEGFSRHVFAPTYEHFADPVRWVNVGGETYTGREAVVAACDRAAAYFATVDSDVGVVRTIEGADVVVVESLGRYVDSDGTSSVASCDLYEYSGDRLVSITSYNVEVQP